MPSLHAADALDRRWFMVATRERSGRRRLGLWPLGVVLVIAIEPLRPDARRIGVAVAALLVTTLGPRLVGRLRGLGPVIANLL
jgi:hypothetical protein